MGRGICYLSSTLIFEEQPNIHLLTGVAGTSWPEIKEAGFPPSFFLCHSVQFGFW